MMMIMKASCIYLADMGWRFVLLAFCLGHGSGQTILESERAWHGIAGAYILEVI